MLLSSADAFEKIIPEEDVNCPVGPVYALSLNPAKGLTVWQSLEKLEIKQQSFCKIEYFFSL